jgi:hypothetical protein
MILWLIYILVSITTLLYVIGYQLLWSFTSSRSGKLCFQFLFWWQLRSRFFRRQSLSTFHQILCPVAITISFLIYCSWIPFRQVCDITHEAKQTQYVTRASKCRFSSLLRPVKCAMLRYLRLVEADVKCCNKLITWRHRRCDTNNMDQERTELLRGTSSKHLCKSRLGETKWSYIDHIT